MDLFQRLSRLSQSLDNTVSELEYLGDKLKLIGVDVEKAKNLLAFFSN